MEDHGTVESPVQPPRLMLDERLANIRKQLEAGAPQQVTVRDLLSWFGYLRRSLYQSPHVRKTLRKHQLETFPDFENVPIDLPVEFRLAEKKTVKAAKEAEQAAKEAEQASQSESDDAPERVVTYKIGRLPAARKKIVSVKPQHPLAMAVTLMIQHDYSQLPVMAGDRDVKGIISWLSIGRKLAMGQSAELVQHAMEPLGERIASSDEVLFDAIERIIKHDFVLVRANDNTLSGIVTTSDLSQEFHDLSVPFLLVGEIENQLRKIATKLPEPTWKNAKDPNDTSRVINDPADLTVGEHVRMLDDPANWQQLEIPLERSVVIDGLKVAARIRNDIMHFDYDKTPAEDVEHLRRTVRLLRQLDHLGLI